MTARGSTWPPPGTPLLFDGSATGRRALQAEAEAYAGHALRTVHRARVLVAGNRSSACDVLRMRRERLSEHLHRYQQFKHRCIFDPVVRLGTSSSKVVAHTLKIECMTMGEVFAAYNARWLRMKPDEWALYRPDMMATTDLLVRHLECEQEAISKLLLIADFYHGLPSAAPAA